ncbi:MAG: TetR family transcriptional regulator [Pseudomonadota bacterium]
MGNASAHETPPEPRKRDAAATAAAILEAARVVFGERGYDAAGTREIAERAQVNVALINRYFGSKEGLFAQAVPPTLDISPLLDGDMASFGERAASLFVGKVMQADYDPLVALVRSATSQDAAPLLRKALSTQVIAPLAERLDGANATERANLIVSHLAGFHLMANLLGTAEATQADLPALRAELAATLQALAETSPSVD